jgi:DNA adenine methylase
MPIPADRRSDKVGVPMHAPAPVRPLLKWAGGKRQLLPQLRPYYPRRFERYIEPFFGSGAVYFDLLNRGHLDDRRAKLVDVNPDLIGCYTALRDHAGEVIGALTALAHAHAVRGSDCYYEVRDRFNRLRGPAPNGHLYTPDLAAMLIYLNRTGFNGLFRQNQRGEFNVPVGRYTNPTVCNPEHLRAVAAALGRRGVTIEQASFDDTLAGASRGDFVYCDPPYAPLSRTASFAHYTAGGFTAFDQLRLQQAVVAAARRGAIVVVSNSSAAEIVKGYSSHEALGAGLVLRRVEARRAINSHGGRRGPVDELIISNAVVPRMVKAGLRKKRQTA